MSCGDGLVLNESSRARPAEAGTPYLGRTVNRIEDENEEEDEDDGI